MLIQYIMNPWYMLFVFTIFLKLTTLGTYAPSFGTLCAATFLTERERPCGKNVPGHWGARLRLRTDPDGAGRNDNRYLLPVCFSGLNIAKRREIW